MRAFARLSRQLAARAMLGVRMTHPILKRLNFTKKYAAWITHDLSNQNCASIMQICRENIRWFWQDTTLLIKVMDESCIFCCDPQCKQQSKTWLLPRETRSTKVQHEASVVKTMWLSLSISKALFTRSWSPEAKVSLPGCSLEFSIGSGKLWEDADHTCSLTGWPQEAS